MPFLNMTLEVNLPTWTWSRMLFDELAFLFMCLKLGQGLGIPNG